MEKKVHPLAGKRPDKKSLITREEMQERYFHPPQNISSIKSGTSGFRGKTGAGFCEKHVAALTQALADIRKEKGTFGPLTDGSRPAPDLGPVIIGKDVRFTSDFAEETAAEVLAGNGMTVILHKGDRSTPTPVISHAILARNKNLKNVEGIIITASHNPPADAGYKSNGLDGGPNTLTKPIDLLANRYLEKGTGINRLPKQRAIQEKLILFADLITPYVRDLKNVIRMEELKKTTFAVTPLGGSANGYYEAINDMYGTDIKIALGNPDPASAQRTYDWDGELRGDPSSPLAMKAIEGLREKLNVPFMGANDNDADRFGGEDAGGILNPNHVLCVAFDYLAKTRGFPQTMGMGRTIGTTHLLDLIAKKYQRPLLEVNVGFKWYVEGLLKNQFVLAGEESAGLSFPRLDGTVWVTEKDGIAAVLLIMEIIAVTGENIVTLYNKLEKEFGPHQYERVDTAATPEKKNRLQFLSANPDEVEKLLAGKKISGKNIERLVIGDGVKVVLEDGIWVLKRASGTEDIIKDYREEKGHSLETARRASLEIDSLLKLTE